MLIVVNNLKGYSLNSLVRLIGRQRYFLFDIYISLVFINSEEKHPTFKLKKTKGLFQITHKLAIRSPLY